MKRKFLLFFLAVVMTMLSIPVSASSANGISSANIVFTNSQLAGESYLDVLKSGTITDEFIRINNIEGQTTRSSTSYYIAEMNAGYMLTSSSSGSFSKTRYNNLGSNNVREWIFSEDTDGNYVVYSKTDTSKCLTVNPSTLSVTLSTYIGSQYQKWGMYYSGNGNALRSEASDTRVSGYKLVINSTTCSVSNSTYTPVGFIDVSWFVPCTSISLSNFTIVFGNSKNLYPTCTGASGATANVSSGNWLDFSVTDGTSNVVAMSSNSLVAKEAGIKKIKIQNKITRAEGYTIVTVQPMQVKLPVTPVEQAKSLWCWAACAEMAGKYAYPSSNRTQWDVVKELKGWLLNPHPNEGGNLNDSINGSEFVAHNTKTFYSSQDVSWETLCDLMNLGKPVQAQVSKYENGVRQIGHIVVIIECYVTGNESSVTRMVRYINPLGGEHTCSYELFCNGYLGGTVDAIVYY